MTQNKKANESVRGNDLPGGGSQVAGAQGGRKVPGDTNNISPKEAEETEDDSAGDVEDDADDNSEEEDAEDAA